MKGHCNKSLKMLFSRGIEDLHDDGFEGSMDEDRIFREVFFGHESGRSSKRCLVTGAINFENDNKKPKDVSFGSNSDNSVMTSQGDSGQGSLCDEFTRNDPDVEVKRRKMSLGEHSKTKPYLEKIVNSSTPSKEVDSCLCQPASIVTCRLVESSGRGVKSSCYLLKGHIGEMGDRDVSKCRLSTSDVNDLKAIIVSKAIASPVSQESHASKLLVTQPEPFQCSNREHVQCSNPEPITCTDPEPVQCSDPEPVQCSKPRWKASSFVELDKAELLVVPNSNMDPRPLLRYHIHRLLVAAGWVIGRRNRKTHHNGEYVFKSPSGRPIREFHRAWNMCGQRLLADANYVVGECDGIQWTDLTHFRSDLSNTLTEVEEQLRNVELVRLAHCWHLLDPFAKVVFIDKTLRNLREGKQVKAERSMVDGLYLQHDDVLPLNYMVTNSNQVVEEPGKESCSLVPFPLPVSRSHNTSCQTGNLHEEHRKSKKISEIKLTKLYRHDQLGASAPYGLHEISESSIQLKSNIAKSSIEANAESYGSCRKVSLCSFEDRNEKKQSKFKKSAHPKHEKEKKRNCLLKDDDLLLSAILKNRSTAKSSGAKKKSHVPKVLRKYKSQKGSCRLLPRSLTKGGLHHTEGKWSGLGVRTILSWLIDFGLIRLNEVIQYRNPKDDSVVKDGLVTRDGILCRCCEKVLSVTEFKSHAGFSLKRPCLNLFLESGKSFTLCQLEAWSAEYKIRKGATGTVLVEEIDENDDSCGLCGDGGELICCDNCPSTFHQGCLCTQELPEGNWYCSQCSCWSCGNVVSDKEASFQGALKCSQCEHKYHEECVRGKGMETGSAPPSWFCGESCKEVHSGLHSRIGVVNSISDGFSWTLLRCIHGDQKVHSQRLLALKAECNLKLAVALTIMEECFLPMVDPRTGIDMIPHVLYNWGSEFARLNYEGFYTMVLEKDDVLLCVASLRIHGVAVAEMPLIATCSKYRRQGMCRRLMNAIEEMLKSFKVQKLVISAIPSLVETWTKGFGFTSLEADEKRSLSNTNLMVFPGTVWLKKPMYQGPTHSTPSVAVASEMNSDLEEAAASQVEITPVDCKEFLQEGGDLDDNLVNGSADLPQEGPPSKIEGSSPEICDVKLPEMYNNRELPLTEQSGKPTVIQTS